MRKTMLITVIIPVYNAEKFLDRAIGSVLNQTYRNIELILVNDGSTDNSERICKEYMFADKRVKLLSQKNSGPAAARNTGINNATGTFAYFLDADDFIERNALEVLISNCQSKPDLVMGNFSKLVNNKDIGRQRVSFQVDDNQFSESLKVLHKPDIIAYVRNFLRHPSNHLISYCWGRLYKLSIIKSNNILSNENMRLFEDFVFNMEYLTHTKDVVFVNVPLYVYVMHDTHVSASMSIVNANSLLHDMNIFKLKTSEFLSRHNDIINNTDIKREIGHALIHYVIIFLVRSCRQINSENRKMIFNEITKLVNAPILKESLPYYSPSKGNSRVLPILMKLKLVGLLMHVSKYKSYKRYGRPKG